MRRALIFSAGTPEKQSKVTAAVPQVGLRRGTQQTYKKQKTFTSLSRFSLAAYAMNVEVVWFPQGGRSFFLKKERLPYANSAAPIGSPGAQPGGQAKIPLPVCVTN